MRNEDSGDAHTSNDDSEQRLIGVFKRRFRELSAELGGNKIQAIVQMGSVEALEKSYIKFPGRVIFLQRS